LLTGTPPTQELFPHVVSAAVSSRTIEPAPPIMAARKENLITGPFEAPGS